MQCSKAKLDYNRKLTLPLIVLIVSCPVKSLLRPKSIIFTHVGSFFYLSIKFSGLMSLIKLGACAYLWEMLLL